MKVYVGLFLCCLVAGTYAAEEPLSPEAVSQFDNHGVTTVCVQVRGVSNSPICGPVVGSLDSPNKDPQGRSNDPQMMSPGLAPEKQLMMEQMMRKAQVPGMFAPPPPRNAVFQDFYEGVPVYQLQRQSEPQLPKSSQSMHLQAPMMKASEPPPLRTIPATPCVETGSGLANPPTRFIAVAPPQNYYNGPPLTPPQYVPRGPESRTIPFAPFGLEPHPQQQMMRQALPMARMPQGMMRSADPNCQDDVHAARGAGMLVRTFPPRGMGSATLPKQAQPPTIEALTKECEEHEKLIKEKDEKITALEQQIALLKDESDKMLAANIKDKKSPPVKPLQEKHDSSQMTDLADHDDLPLEKPKKEGNSNPSSSASSKRKK